MCIFIRAPVALLFLSFIILYNLTTLSNWDKHSFLYSVLFVLVFEL